MSYSSDDLAPLFGAASDAGSTVRYRQGVIQVWNPDTAENTVEVGGALVDNLPVLNTNEVLLLAPGDVVGILSTGESASSWCILGRLTVPGTAQAAQTLGAGMKVATVIIGTDISSASYALNGGPTVTTKILPTGRAYISYGAGMDLDVGEGVDFTVTGTGPGGVVWWGTTALTGSNVLTVSSGTLGGTISLGSGMSEMVQGLTPGQWTFEMHSRKKSGTGNPSVYNRQLSVMPL